MKRWLSLLVLAPVLAGADERILDYHSDILVRQDGWIEVTETIRVRAEGQQIRRGLYRDYPTDYVDAYGNDHQVVYEPLSVLRNGRSEAFHTEKYRNGVRTYFGSANRMLPPGEHTYTYRYAADRMLGFFEEHDELYWNVTGDGWDFPIDRATATVTFEFELPTAPGEIAAYTGRFGATGQDARGTATEVGASFETTRPLGLREGLTIAVAWPKGYVDEPTWADKAGWVISDNRNLLVAFAGLLAMFVYYIPAWRAFGRDPAQGVVFTRYEPPQGYSPASLRYVREMGYDNEAMTAGVVSLAVKGYLRITRSEDLHTLKRQDPGADAPTLATGERELHDALFEESNFVVLDEEYHERIGGARSAHESSLRRDYKHRYFKTNLLLNLPPLLLLILATAISLNIGSGPSIPVSVVLVIAFLTLAVFAGLMKRPTMRGRKLLDELEGFREYLEIAEKDEMNLRNPPEKTPELFEKYLPFALAIGVEQAWAERFAAVFAALEREKGSAYHPDWFNGEWDSTTLSSSMSSASEGLGSAISSSVTPPGSSSGVGGGGFSGGGGGGGGGGGW